MILLLPLFLAIACLLVSVVASIRSASFPKRHQTANDEVVNQLVAIASALWSIAFLLLWIGLR